MHFLNNNNNIFNNNNNIVKTVKNWMLTFKKEKEPSTLIVVGVFLNNHSNPIPYI